MLRNGSASLDDMPDRSSWPSASTTKRRPESPLNIARLTACITCSVRMPRTMPTSTARDGSYSTSSCGLPATAALPKNERPARSPKFLGMITATLVVPFRTRSRASAAVVNVTFRFLSACAPATTACEIVLASSSTMATVTRGGSSFRPEPPVIDPMNVPIAMGTANATMTARRSLKNNSRSLRTRARRAIVGISRAGSFRSA